MLITFYAMLRFFLLTGLYKYERKNNQQLEFNITKERAVFPTLTCPPRVPAMM